MNNRQAAPQNYPTLPGTQNYPGPGPGPGNWGEEEDQQQIIQEQLQQQKQQQYLQQQQDQYLQQQQQEQQAQLQNQQQQAQLQNQQQAQLQNQQQQQWGAQGPQTQTPCPPGMMPFSQLPPSYQSGILNSGQYPNSINRRGYGGYLNMQQGPEDCNACQGYDQQGYMSQTNFPCSSGPMMSQPCGGQSQYPLAQQPCCDQGQGQCQDNSSLIGFQAVKLIRKIWGTPCKKGQQILACRPTCGGKAICKPVSCVMTAKCPKKRCAPVCPQPTCRMQMQSTCQPSCPTCLQLGFPCQACSCSTPRKKCQYRVVSQPRRMVLMRANDQCAGNGTACCPQSCQEPIVVTMRECDDNQNPQPSCPCPCPAPPSCPCPAQPACPSQATTCCEQGLQAQAPAAATDTKRYTETGVGCSTDERYMATTRRESSGAFAVRGGVYYDRYDRYDGGRNCAENNYCDDDDYDRGRGRSGSCDSCESFERWREKCECRKKMKEECEKKATKDGQNDPKPIDTGTSSDDKLGKKGKSVSVNTSKTKANKKPSKSKLKKSKSAGSVKSKGKKGKGKGKGGKGKGKGKGKKKK